MPCRPPVAALVETHPAGDRNRASLVGSAATVGGAAMGPLLAGVLGQYGAWPRRLPFVVEIGLLGAAFVVLAISFPDDSSGATPWRPCRPSVPEAMRRTFALAAFSAFLAWAVASLFLSLIPGYVTDVLGASNLAFTGGLAATMLGASALIQLGARRVPSLSSQVIGLALVAAASAALVVVADLRSLPVMVAAAVAAGLGLGFVFRGSLSEINAVAPDDRRGDIVASFYLVVYLGTALPVVGVGSLALATGLLRGVQVFGCAIGPACILGLGLLLADRHRVDRLAGDVPGCPGAHV